MISYTNKNIYIPFREDARTNSNKMFKVVKEYYNILGYNVVALDSGDENFNLSKSRNMAFTNYDDNEVILINADCLIFDTAIENSLQLIKERSSIVKPFLKLLRISDIDKKFIESVIDNEIFDIKIESQSNSFYPGEAFILNKSSWEKVGGFNENILDPIISSIDFCLRASELSELVFLEYDAYSFHHPKVSGRKERDGESHIFEVNKSFFNADKNIYLSRFGNKLIKMNENENKISFIFNLENYQ